MAIWAKQLKILHHVIPVIPIYMMDLEHQFFPVPLPDSTYLAVSVTF